MVGEGVLVLEELPALRARQRLLHYVHALKVLSHVAL